MNTEGANIEDYAKTRHPRCGIFIAEYVKRSFRKTKIRGRKPMRYMMVLSAPAHKSHNRHEKRTSAHFSGRKNTRGFELGFNAKTWSDYCVGKAKLRKERQKKLAKKTG